MSIKKVNNYLKANKFIDILTNNNETIPRKALNSIIEINPGDVGYKYYLPHVDESDNGSRLIISNISTSRYFWLYQNTNGYAIDGRDFILIAPRTQVELIFNYDFSRWTIVGGHVFLSSLSIHTDSTWTVAETDIQKILDAFPKKALNNAEVFLILADGTYNLTSTLNIEGIEGGNLKILGNSSDTGETKNVIISSDLSNATIISISHAEYVYFQYLNFRAPNVSGYPLMNIFNSNVSLTYNRFDKNNDSGSPQGIALTIGHSSDVYVAATYFNNNFSRAINSDAGITKIKNLYLVSSGTKADYGLYARESGTIIELDSTSASAIGLTPRFKNNGGSIILSDGQLWKTDNDISACRVVKSASQTFNNNTETLIQYDYEDYDYGSNYDNTTYTFTAPFNGIFDVKAQIRFPVQTSTYLASINIYKNSTMIASKPLEGGTLEDLVVANSTDIFLSSGDTIQIKAVQKSGNNLIVTGISYSTFMSISLIKRIE